MPESGGSAESWARRLRDAGLVLEHLGPDALWGVATGEVALDATVKEARRVKAQKERRAELPEDLGTLVDAGEFSMGIALRRSKLPPRYARLVASEELSLDEAEHLAQRDEQGHRESVHRSVSALEGFLYGWSVAANLQA